MANICYGKINVLVPTKNKEEFLNLFYGMDKDGNYVGAWIDDFRDELEYIDLPNGITYIKGNISCRWSFESSSLNRDGYSDEKFLTFKEAFEKYDVEALNISAEEPGVGFIETISYDRESDELYHEVYDYVDMNAKEWWYEDYASEVESKSKKTEEEMER